MKTFVIDNDAIKKAWGAEEQYWFSIEDYKIMEDIDFLRLSLSNSMDKDEIFGVDEFIPYFNFKRHELARAYVKTIDNEKVKAKFDKKDDSEVVEYFWKCFHVYPDLFKNIEEFQSSYILNRLENWCEENGISYTVEI